MLVDKDTLGLAAQNNKGCNAGGNKRFREVNKTVHPQLRIPRSPQTRCQRGKEKKTWMARKQDAGKPVGLPEWGN